MSEILGIISEYNPFHNGHLYHLQKSKELIDPDYTVCIMSGNFVQRGNTSLVDKWCKAEMAIKAGVDLVIELPVVYSTSSAENFAQGAIKILDNFNMNTTLSFGSECGNIHILNSIADILNTEPKEYLSILNHELSLGVSYPKAREKALLMYLNDVRKYANVLSGSNNILGIEYLKAIKRLRSDIIPTTVRRLGPGYISSDINTQYASATAIRKYVTQSKNIDMLSKVMPQTSYDILSSQLKYGKVIPNLSVYEKEIIYTLRKMTLKEISELQDVSEGLENRIKASVNSCNTLEELINKIKTKRYTRTRIQRILVYALLNITKKDIEQSYKATPYIRVLGMNSHGRLLLSRLVNTNKKVNVITSVKKYVDSNTNKVLENMLSKDILATNIYTLPYPYDSQANLDYTKKLIIL